MSWRTAQLPFTSLSRTLLALGLLLCATGGSEAEQPKGLRQELTPAQEKAATCWPARMACILRPGQVVITTAGIQVWSAPRWRDGQDVVHMTVMIRERKELALPLDPEIKLGLPLYWFGPVETALTADAVSFVVRIPTVDADPKRLYGLMLTEMAVGGAKRLVWQEVPSAKVKNGFLEFQIPGFMGRSELMFTAGLLPK